MKPETLIALFFAIGMALLVAVLVGCPGPYEKACSAADLEKLEANYQAELVRYCAAETTIGNKCSQRPRIDAKYRAKREAWVRCDAENQ